MNEPPARVPAELLRWGRAIAARSAQAANRVARVELALERARRGVGRALRATIQADQGLAPGREQVRRIAEVAHAAGEATTRTDLLALHVQVEAARLGEDDRGLDAVAEAIRTLADRGTRGAAEIEELAGQLLREWEQLQEAWATGRAGLEAAGRELERGQRVATASQRALSSAGGTTAAFALGSEALAVGSFPEEEGALRLASAASVRAGTLGELAHAAATRLATLCQILGEEAARSEDASAQAAEHVERLERLHAFVSDADEIARRAKQLALNADLAATRSEDPAFGLFAEEARRLGEQAAEVAVGAQAQLEDARGLLAPAAQRQAAQATSLRDLVEGMAALVALLDPDVTPAAPPPPMDAEEFLTLRRADRAAGRALNEARARWLPDERDDEDDELEDA